MNAPMALYHPFDETLWDEPFETYRRLRDEAPAYYLPELDCWFVSRFEDVWRNPDLIRTDEEKKEWQREQDRREQLEQGKQPVDNINTVPANPVNNDGDTKPDGGR